VRVGLSSCSGRIIQRPSRIRRVCTGAFLLAPLLFLPGTVCILTLAADFREHELQPL
jgi:hypothetical protein